MALGEKRGQSLFQRFKDFRRAGQPRPLVKVQAGSRRRKVYQEPGLEIPGRLPRHGSGTRSCSRRSLSVQVLVQLQGRGCKFPPQALVPLRLSGLPRGRRMERVLLRSPPALVSLHPGAERGFVVRDRRSDFVFETFSGNFSRNRVQRETVCRGSFDFEGCWNVLGGAAQELRQTFRI